MQAQVGARMSDTDQYPLGDTADRLIDVREFNEGFSAGWRADEIIGDQSYSFNNGYEWGLVAREKV